MSYAVRAWRERNGKHGITIGVLIPVGYDNHVAELDLSGPEADEFIAACSLAAARASQARGVLSEPIPGAYETWDGAETAPKGERQ